MKKLESSFTNMVVMLTTFAVVIGALLAWVNHVTEAPIKAQEEKTLSDGIKSVMGGKEIEVAHTDTVKQEVDGKELTLVLYNIETPKGTKLGTAVESGTQGFGGDLRLLVGFDTKSTILGYTVLQSSETPGLGAKADKWFQKGGKGSIIGLSPATNNLTVKKDGGDIDAITASTITSRAFLKAVRTAYDAVKANNADSETTGTSQTDGKTSASEQHSH